MTAKGDWKLSGSLVEISTKPPTPSKHRYPLPPDPVLEVAGDIHRAMIQCDTPWITLPRARELAPDVAPGVAEEALVYLLDSGRIEVKVPGDSSPCYRVVA